MHWKDLEGNSSGLNELPSRYIPGVTEENHINSVTMVYVLADIQTEQLPNKSLVPPD
jgi:hypothetical protein